MDIFQAIFLGILQGISEFLPISSSGHLALARLLLGRDLEPSITFEIVVHFGSFCSIVLYYRKMIGNILADFFQSLKPSSISAKRFKKDKNTLLVIAIGISMIPAMLVGFTLKDTIEELFVNPVFVASMLLITGTFLFSTKFSKKNEKEVSIVGGLLMGVAQAFAIMPGISRSGSTISLALLFGIKREEAANFSFLMVLPVLAGAMLLEVKDILEFGIGSLSYQNLIIGFFSSFLVGYAALAILIKILRKDQFHYFSYYCWAAGATALIYFI